MIVEVTIARVEGGTGHGGHPAARADDTVTFDEDEFLSLMYAWKLLRASPIQLVSSGALSSLPSGRGRSRPPKLQRLSARRPSRCRRPGPRHGRGATDPRTESLARRPAR